MMERRKTGLITLEGGRGPRHFLDDVEQQQGCPSDPLLTVVIIDEVARGITDQLLDCMLFVGDIVITGD